MAIGTAAAIGLGVAGIGSAIGSKSSSKAAGKAADASVEGQRIAAQTQREFYANNEANLSPFMARGNAAGSQINALLGLGGEVAPQPAQVQPNALSQFIGSAGNNGIAMDSDMFPITSSNFNAVPRDARGNVLQNFAPGYETPGYGGGTPMGQRGGVDSSVTPQQAANNAFDVFRNSTGYQFRLGEGVNALNSGYAGAGVVRSGAAMKDAVRYGQDFASNEFGNYMGYLGQQQGVGLSGANALAGVSTNVANNISAGQMEAANARGNAALVKGQNNPFANVFGTIGGGLLSGAFG